MKIKTVLITLILFTISLFCFNFNVKGATVDSLTVYQLGWTSPDIENVSGWYQTYNFNGTYWANMGSGTIIFNLSPHCYNFNCDNGIKPITEIDVMTNNDLSVCDIGTVQSTTYVQNTVLYTAKCHVSSGVTGIRIHYQNSVCPSCTDFYGYQFSDSFTYVQDGDDSSTVVNSISGLNSSFQNSLNSLNSSINNASSQAHNDSQAIQSDLDDIKNADINSSDKQQPDHQEYTDYQTAENNLFDKMDNADLSNLDVALDSNSSNFIWDTIVRFYNSNALILNFVISILSVGIIKMALGR